MTIRRTRIGGYEASIISYPDDKFVELMIPSSKDPEQEYSVIIDAQDKVCSCRGFLFRQYCKHIDLATAALSRGEDVGLPKIRSI